MKRYKASSLVKVFLLLTLASGRIFAFRITEATADRGDSVEYPASTDPSAPSINLECKLDFNQNSREKWTTCQWTKQFPHIPVDWTQRNSLSYAFIMCSSTHEDDNGKVCEDQGNLGNKELFGNPLNNPYTQYDTSRLNYYVRDNVCGLTINRPHANDTGEWKCYVQDNNPDVSAQWGKVNLYTAVKSVVNITQPDMVRDPSYSISVDLSSSSRQDLQVLECTASGSPPPNIIWYIDEPRNEIDKSLYSQSREGTGFDIKVVSTLSRLSLDRQSLQRYGVSMASHNSFSFSVGCKPDQENFFNENNNENEQQWSNTAEVMVYGTSGSGASMTSVVTVIIVMIAPWLL